MSLFNAGNIPVIDIVNNDPRHRGTMTRHHPSNQVTRPDHPIQLVPHNDYQGCWGPFLTQNPDDGSMPIHDIYNVCN